MLAYLTGKGYSDWDVVSETPEEKNIPAEATYAFAAENNSGSHKSNDGLFYTALGLMGVITIGGLAFGRKA